MKKTPTKCGTVPIKPRKSRRPIKRSTKHASPPPKKKQSFFSTILDPIRPSHQRPTLRPRPPPEIPD